MKIGLISDFHFRHDKGEKLIQNKFDTLNYFLELCRQRNVQRVFFLGDLFEFKDKVSPLILIPVIEYFDKFPLNISFLAGNHDSISSNLDINLMKVFYKNISSYQTEIIDGNKFHYLPYMPDRLLENIELDIDPKKKNILFTHLCLFDFAKGHEDVTSIIDSEYFYKRGIDLIFSGHIHNYSHIGNTVYISSPFMSNFGEIGSEDRHGFVFLDTETLKHEFVPNPLTPKFMIESLNKNTISDLLKLKNYFLRIKIEQNIKSDLLTKTVEKLRENNYSVELDYQLEKREDKIVVLQSWESIATIDSTNVDELYINSIDLDESKKKEYLTYLKELK